MDFGGGVEVSKEKRAYKKELKKKMNLKLKDRIKRKYKKFKLIFVIMATVAAIIAAIKTIEMLLVKKNKKRDKDSSLEQFFSLFASTKETIVKKITGGVMVGAYFSNMNIDCSECEFSDGSFIAIKSAVACINITIPENVNVKFDCINLFTYVKQEYDTDEVIESRPTVYIALKGAFSSVIISKAEKVEEEEKDNTEAAKA